MTKKNIEEMERRERVFQIYREDSNNEEYRITKEDFRDWLKENNQKDSFIKDLKEAKEDIISVYDIAIDYSISVELVKFFMREYL